MERGSDMNFASPNSLDKSKVYDVKPLRSLVPLFSSTGQTPPFISAPPSGPFPSGFSPFYPFSGPQGSQSSPDPDQHNLSTNATTQVPYASMPTPIRSFRSPQTSRGPPYSSGPSNGQADASGSTHFDDSNSLKKRAKKSRDLNSSSSGGGVIGPSKNFVVGISSSQREDGNREIVDYLRMTYDGLRRRLSQLDDSKETANGPIRRTDLKAGNIMMTVGLRTNVRRRIGSIPGVEVGDIFFFRMELCVLGLHAPSMGGIDYMSVKNGLDDEPLALSIVSSGGYDDDADDSDILIYSGQGGTVNNKQAADQKLQRGNLALERSLHRGNEIRVIRGMKDVTNPLKIYFYDGLYTIQETWTEKGKSGCNTFKYKLVRMPNQPDAFAIWKSVQKWRENMSSRPGLILPDLTSGAENTPVALVNDVDSEKGPACFTYFPTLKCSKSLNLPNSSFSCNCQSACLPGDVNCSCIKKNGGDFPYTNHSVLVSRKPLVHECGPTCRCFPNCKNRVSQTGLKVRLEVFKTKDKGWGLRSWDPIRAGTFICEYAGEVLDYTKAKQAGAEADVDDYVFDTSRVYGSFKWNYEPGLLDEDKSSDSAEEYNISSPIIISAKNNGNVSRFMNHSCSPNVFWQPIMYEHNNEPFIHIGFFAMRQIPPMKELTYDYGIACAGETDGNSVPSGRKKCLCGSSKCQGYFG